MSSLRSPPVDLATSRDPFQLERLAEELATRELRSSLAGEGTEHSEAAHDLPLYVPLSHDNPYLSADVFNVEDFLLSRSYTSLPDLRAELRDYLATLKEELVKLINDDYEAFISLSTDLRGEGTRLERLKRPLANLRLTVVEARKELQTIQDAINLKLKKRSALREEKAFLHMLLKISESISRLESLLLITAPANEQSAPDLTVLKSPKHIDDDNAEGRTSGNRAKHLSRVAAEYMQLLYHVSKARTEKSAFVDESQWRIDRIKSTLSSDLDHLFATTVSVMTERKGSTKVSDGDKVKWSADVTECLRTYDVLGLWQDAEEVLRTDLVRGFVKKTIYPGALSAPHSPIVPHTPFVTIQFLAPPPTASLPPRTPYTPFTAFASKQNPFDLSLERNSSLIAHAHILDDTEDPLAGLYNTVLRFVDRDLKRIMEIAEKVCIKSGARSTKAPSTAIRTPYLANPSSAPQTQETTRGFEIMANVIWAEVGKAIMEELGGVVFAAGRPDEFRKHHETTQAFIRALEFLAPSVHSIEAMRAHPIYTAFDRRWQLSVYFQLRWKEMMTKVEEALTTTRLERSNKTDSFVTLQASAVWEAIITCWSAEVYIPKLSNRFWKLMLQLISRFKKWLDDSLPALEPPSRVTAAAAAEKASGAQSLARSSTPNTVPEAASAESIVADEALLLQFATAITDIKEFQSRALKLWQDQLCILLTDTSAPAEDGAIDPKDTLDTALSEVTAIIPPLSSQIIMLLSRRACEALLPMRSIPSQFRAMSSGRRVPTEPSYFVSLIFRPLKAFFAIGTNDGPGAALKTEYLKPYAEEVFETVAQRYIYFLTAMRKTEESLRKLKRGKKSTFSLFSASNAGREDEGRADEEKIRAQMVMDVDAFGKEAETLGILPHDNATYISLKEMANSNLTEE